MKGYKVFNNDWTCRGFQYKVGETYKIDEKPELCTTGFHFCEKLKDCFLYYPFDSSQVKIAEVEALGKIVYDKIDSVTKRCTNKIKIIREIPFNQLWFEAQEKFELIPLVGRKRMGILPCCSVAGTPVVGGEIVIIDSAEAPGPLDFYHYLVKYNALINVEENVDGI